MKTSAPAKIKANPILGMRPSLENHRIGDLNIDPTYQRSVESGSSQNLIRKIAMYWDWSLFHPLAVARRPDGSLWVVDGQHRLAAARLRNDLYDLPCVVTASDSVEDEAASFVAMNVQRRPLNALELFRAALAAGDDTARKIMGLITAAGLTLAPHSNHTAWKAGAISNIAGIKSMYRMLGKAPTSAALVAISTAFAGQVLQYGGTLFAGLARAYAQLLSQAEFDPDLFIDVISGGSQREWYTEIAAERGNSQTNLPIAGETVFLRAYREAAAVDQAEAA